MSVFLSYKSEDANLVRGVAERLLASGLDVWFNEYDIPIERYEAFEDEIDAGIRKATHAIVFTNRRWTASDWCRYEMRGLLARLPRPEQIVEVCIPKDDEPHREFGALADGEPIVFPGDFQDPAGEDLDDLARQVRERLRPCGDRRDHWTEAAAKRTRNAADRTATAGGPPAAPIRLPRFGTTFDAGPFRPSLERTDEYREKLGMGLALVAEIDGVEAFLDLHVWPLRSVLDSLSIRQDQASDDRAVFTAYRRYAGEWLHGEEAGRPRSLEAKGLHLVFIDGRSHLGLTYVSRAFDDGDALWERRYAITTKGQAPLERGEIGLIFMARVAGTADEQRRSFCALCPTFDAIARSVRYQTPSVVIAVSTNLAIVLSRAAYASGATWLLWWTLQTEQPPTALVPASLAAGYVAGDLISVCSRRLYRRVLWTMQPLSHDLLPAASPVRLLVDFLYHLYATPLMLLAFLSHAASLVGKSFSRMLLAMAVVWTYVALFHYGYADGAYASWAPAAFAVTGAAIGLLFNLASVHGFMARKKERLARAAGPS